MSVKVKAFPRYSGETCFELEEMKVQSFVNQISCVGQTFVFFPQLFPPFWPLRGVKVLSDLLSSSLDCKRLSTVLRILGLLKKLAALLFPATLSFNPFLVRPTEAEMMMKFECLNGDKNFVSNSVPLAALISEFVMEQPGKVEQTNLVPVVPGTAVSN